MRLATILSVLILLYSCCGKPEELTHEFDSGERSWLHYNNYDTLTFLVNNTAKIKLVVRNKSIRTVPDGEQCNCCKKTHDNPIHGEFKLCYEKDSNNLDLFPHIEIDENEKSFRKNLYYLYYQSLDNPNIDSTVVNGKIYKNVYRLSIDPKYNSTSAPTVSTVYYTRFDGFIRFDFFKGDKWEIIK